MRERTAFRLAMLANGFQPLLNDCKRAIETGWPTKVVDEAEVLSWDRSALASTGLRLDGDLAVIDVDVIEPDLIEALVSAIDHQFPELLQAARIPPLVSRQRSRRPGGAQTSR